MPDTAPRNIVERFFMGVVNIFDGPTTYVREKIVLPNQKHYPWYHQKFRRVPTIDQCYTDDVVCKFEADSQYRRDRMVDTQILQILRERFEECVMYEKPDHKEKCSDIWNIYEDNSGHWFTKYGDLGAFHDSLRAYMKQKHRMIWERRHGPVGSGMKKPADIPNE